MIAVTGGAGFIGSHLVERLLAAGNPVVVLDSFDDFYDPAVKWANLAPLLRDRGKGLDLVVGDIRDQRALDRTLGGRGVTTIVHLAARPGVQPSLRSPAHYMDVNVTGTMRVLEAAVRAGIGEVVIASSSSVYGDVERVPLREDESEGTVASPYGASKRAMEIAARSFAELASLRVTALRFFTAYGPRQRPDMAIHKFARSIEAGEPITLFGGGETRRDYTYVSDVVDGIVRSIGRPGPPFRAYNLGREEPVSLAQLVLKLEEALGRRALTETLPEQPGDVHVTSADCSRARAELGYAPRVSLREGLAEFVRWLRA